jgi:diacylglycerol kinase (ATP)
MLTPHPQLAGERAIALLSRANIDRLLEFKSLLTQVFPRMDVVAPQDLDHLGQVVKRSHGTHKLVLAIGGDGMLHQVLQHVNLADQVLGVLPAGTGNDFARSLNFPKGMRERIAHLAQLKTLPIDFGLINDVRFINSAGFGLDAATLRVRHTHGGLLHRSYQAAFLYGLVKMKPWDLKVDVDGELIEGLFYWPLAMNTPYIGGGVKIAPKALIDDGLLDIVLIKQLPKLKMAQLLPAAAKGQHLQLPEVIYRQARTAVCKVSRPVDWMAVDGEERICGAREVRFSVQAGRLAFLR